MYFRGVPKSIFPGNSGCYNCSFRVLSSIGSLIVSEDFDWLIILRGDKHIITFSGSWDMTVFIAEIYNNWPIEPGGTQKKIFLLIYTRSLPLHILCSERDMFGTVAKNEVMFWPPPLKFLLIELPKCSIPAKILISSQRSFLKYDWIIPFM